MGHIAHLRKLNTYDDHNLDLEKENPLDLLYWNAVVLRLKNLEPPSPKNALVEIVVLEKIFKFRQRIFANS